jgi:subtilisin family serine protease
VYAAGERARATSAAIAAQYGLQNVAEWPITALKVNCLVYKVPEGRSREQMLAALAHDPRVQLAQPLQRFTTLASPYNDPYIGLQRGFARIDAAGAQQWSRGEGVRVAVIDTGLDTTHPDLVGRIERQRNFVDDNPSQFAADRHGTEVAGVIGADANNHEGIVGVAPGVRILALKACWQLDAGNDAAQCNSFTLAKALAIAIDSGARIINLSLGGPPDPLLTQLLSYALSRGIVIVGAVPSDGRMDGFPIGVPGVIAVDTLEQSAAAGSALHAPGHEVLTLTPGGHYDFVSGSSLAAAHVTGAVALLISADHRLDARAVYELLKRTSTGSEGLGRAINVCAAVAAMRNKGERSEGNPGCYSEGL